MLMSKCKDLKENNGLICILHVKYIRLHRLHFEIWSYRILFWMCHIWCIYTWFSIHVTCLPFDPKYNKYQNNKIPIWKVHEGLRDSGRRLVRPRLEKQIWKLSLKLGFSHWVSNLKITMFNCRDVPKQRWSMTKQNWCWQLQHVKIIDGLIWWIVTNMCRNWDSKGRTCAKSPKVQPLRLMKHPNYSKHPEMCSTWCCMEWGDWWVSLSKINLFQKVLERSNEA